MAVWFVAVLCSCIAALCWRNHGVSFVAPLAMPRMKARRGAASGVRLRAEVVDAKMADADSDGEVDESQQDEMDGDDEEFAEEFADDDALMSESEVAIRGSSSYPPEAYRQYAHDVAPPQSWFDRRKIDRHKVNMKIFDLFKKPKEFFPYDLRPGDTVRIFFLDATEASAPLTIQGVDTKGETMNWQKTRKVFFDGIVLEIVGNYQNRGIRIRAMVGKGIDAVGYEMFFPMHSPLVTGIKVLRRGYIGRNKNAFFMRGMIGKKNVIPLDVDRTQVDAMHEELRDSGREDEIPPSNYPMSEFESYPWPSWRQDLDDWDEANYHPDMVDTRSEYEKTVIGKFRQKFFKVPRPNPAKFVPDV